MDWDAIGAIGEIVGALAVVISLGYLATQIRLQNREARHASMHEISVAFRESLGGIDREFTDVLALANQDFGQLTESDTMILMARGQIVLRVWEEAYQLFQVGRLDNHIWESMTSQYSAFLGSPGIAKVWELRKEFYEPHFREYVESTQKTPLHYK